MEKAQVFCYCVENRGRRTDSMHLRFQKGDILAIALPLLVAVAVLLAFLPGKESSAPIAAVYQDGSLIQRISLDTEQSFTITADYRNTITVRDGKIAITDSDCPGGDCMHTGWISTSGRSIVCLPNRLEIRVVSAVGDVDFIVG